MKLSVMLYSFGRAIRRNEVTVEGALKCIKECGVDAVDIMRGYPGEPSVEDQAKMLQDIGLVNSCMIGSADFTNPDAAVRAQGVDKAREALDVCVALGGKTMLLVPGRCRPGQSPEDARALIAEGFSKVLPFAKEAGVALCFENVNGPVAPYVTPQDVTDLINRAGPDLKYCYDYGNWLLDETDGVAALDEFKDHVVHVHCKDWRELPPGTEKGVEGRTGKKFEGVVCGDGIADYPAAFKALKAAGYQGYLAFEYENDPDALEACRRGTAYLKSVLDQI